MRPALIAACLALAAALPAAAQTAAGQSAGAAGWVLVSVGGVAALDGGRIAFASDGAVFGTTGCNRFQGQVVAAPGVVTFTAPLATTRMACPGEEMTEQEAQVLAALQGAVAVAYDPVAERLVLIPQDAAVLTFARAD